MPHVPEYAWFVAAVETTDEGDASAWIYEWDVPSGTVGALVDSFTFGEEPNFYAVLESRYYEAVEGKLARSVSHRGFRIAVRKEKVPVLVPARVRA